MAHTQVESRDVNPAVRPTEVPARPHRQLSAGEERELRLRLSRWSRRFLGLPDAEFADAYQGAWRKVLDGERRGRAVRNLEHALRWGIHNSWLEECRRRRRRPTAPLDETSPTAYRSQAPADPAEQVERLESARYLFEAVGTIDELSWRVVLLRRVWGLSPAEICSTLGISRRTYRTEHARALTLIYKRLSETLAGQECAERHAALRAVAAEDADAELEQGVGAHVRNCSSCRRLLAAMQRSEPVAA